MFRKIFSVFSAVALIFYFSNPIYAEDDGLDEFDDIVEVELNLDDDVDDGLDDFDDDDDDSSKEAEKLDGDDMVKIDPTYTENYSDEYYSDENYSNDEYSEPIQPAQPRNYVRVAVIIDTPGGIFYEPEAVYNSAKKLMKDILENQPELQMLPIENVNAYVQMYREESNLDEPTADVKPEQVRPTLKRANLNELDDLLKAKFVFYIRVTSTKPRSTYSILDTARRVNVTTDFRIWSQDKENFVYAKRYMATGVSKSYFSFLTGSSYHAVRKGMNKAFKNIRMELPQIQAAIRN